MTTTDGTRTCRIARTRPAQRRPVSTTARVLPNADAPPLIQKTQKM